MTNLNETSWQQAEAAMRDILFLYRDLTEYRGFSGDHPTGSFAAWKWLACQSEGGWGTPDDVQLLQEGSAVALIVELIDTWDQADGVGVETFKGGLRSRRFDHLPTARAAIEAGLTGTDSPHFTARAKAAYEEYVLHLFGALAASRPQD